MTLSLPFIVVLFLLRLITLSFYNHSFLNYCWIRSQFKHCHPTAYPRLQTLLESPSFLSLVSTNSGTNLAIFHNLGYHQYNCTFFQISNQLLNYLTIVNGHWGFTARCCFFKYCSFFKYCCFCRMKVDPLFHSVTLIDRERTTDSVMCHWYFNRIVIRFRSW